MNQELKKSIIQLETDLHKFEIRSNVNRLNELLAEGYFEIGASGNSYTKKDILTRLPDEETREIKSYDFEVREITEEVIQIFYKTESTTRMAARNSIWLKVDSSWKMVFHQGTLLI